MRALGAWLCLGLSLAVGGIPGSSAALADVATVTPSPTVTVTSTPSPTVTPTLAPTARPTSRPTATPYVRRETHHRRHHARATALPTATPTERPTRPATPAPTPSLTKRARRIHHHHRKKPTSTPTATPSPTPLLNLNTEDSISPVTCNGKGKSVASAPFLQPPYRGWTSLVSYFDHDSPNFAQDGLIVTTTGAEGRPDTVHSGSGFPAYWAASMRQYLYYDGHNGYDYNLSYRPVYAAAAGKVIFADWEYPTMPDHGYGRMVMIAHAHGYVTLYGHFSHFLVHKGQRVRRGQRIGTSGNTGHSTGPHLHFTVFHNCTPVDPYGWNGQGPDPLASYQGESSTYLWMRQPLIANPPPGWPHLGGEPGSPTGVIALLRLPASGRGTAQFSRALQQEASRVVTAIQANGGIATADLVRGAVVVYNAAPPAQLLAIPGVVSITTNDTIEGEKIDVLQALARAGLVDHQRQVALGGGHHWTGRLLRWQGRVLLVGKGARNQSVTLHLDAGHGGAAHTVHTDPSTGAYAIDLGALTRPQFAALERSLTRHPHRSVVTTTARSRHRSPVRSATHSSSFGVWKWIVLALIVAGIAALGCFKWGVQLKSGRPETD